MNQKQRSLANSRSEAQKIYYQRKEIKRLQQENERLTNELNTCMIERNNFLSRIEKAVEYINHLSKEPNVFGHYGIHNDCAKWLLNILNGRSDE